MADSTLSAIRVFMRVSKLSKTTKAKLGDLRHYSTTDNTNYFKERYNETTSVIQVENGTILKDTVSKKVISDLIVGDASKAEVKILREIVVIEKTKFKFADKTIDSLNLGLETVTNRYELANSEKDKAISKTEQAFKRERNKKNFYKLTTLMAVLGGGYLLLK